MFRIIRPLRCSEALSVHKVQREKQGLDSQRITNHSVNSTIPSNLIFLRACERWGWDDPIETLQGFLNTDKRSNKLRRFLLERLLGLYTITCATVVKFFSVNENRLFPLLCKLSRPPFRLNS